MSSMSKWRANVRDVISDTHQLLLVNCNLMNRAQWYFIGDKTNLQTVKIESDILTVWNSEIITFDFTEKSL